MKHEKLVLESCLMDDEYMSRYFMDNKKCAAYVLNTLIPNKELEVTDVKIHYSIPNLENRDVILDIYASDSNGKLYDIEVQRRCSEAHPKRARYYSSLVDANILDPGREFRDLVETWVIFIIDGDFFKEGLPLYTIDRVVNEIGEKFEDGSHIMYVNGKYRGDDPVGKLIHDLYCSKPEDMLCPVLAEQAYIYKRTEGGKRVMSEYIAAMVEQEYGELIRNARKEAEEERRKLKAELEAKLEAELAEKRKLEKELEKSRRAVGLLEGLDEEKMKTAVDYLEQLSEY